MNERKLLILFLERAGVTLEKLDNFVKFLLTHNFNLVHYNYSGRSA